MLFFFERRVRRLLLPVFCILLVSLFFSFVSPTPDVGLKTGLFATFGFSNFFLFSLSTNYFSESLAANPFAHTWSLGVEEQIYLVFPIIYWLICFSSSRLTSKVIRYSLYSLSFASLFAFFFLYSENTSMVYFLTFFRLWQILLGSLFYYLYRIGFQTPFSPPVYLATLYCLFFLDHSWAPYTNIFASFVTALLLLPNHSKSFDYIFLKLPLFTYLGLISYSLYLWHWPLISLFQWTVGLTKYTLPLYLLLVFSLSIFSYHYIELPFKTFKSYLSGLKAVFVAFSSSIFVSSLIFGLSRLSLYRSLLSLKLLH